MRFSAATCCLRARRSSAISLRLRKKTRSALSTGSGVPGVLPSWILGHYAWGRGRRWNRKAGRAAAYRARDPLYPLEPARAEYPVAARPVCRLAGGPGRCALRDHLPRTTIATLIPSYSCLTTAQPRTIKYDRHRGHMPADRSIGVSIGEGMFTRRKP